MINFEEYLYESMRNKIESWDSRLIEEIYAISFYIENKNDDYRLPSVTLGYNTWENVNKQQSDASDLDEAKWNYAFWLQNRELVIGDSYFENNGAEKVDHWIRELGLYFTDEEEEKEFDRTCELGEEIKSNFVKIVLTTVQRLHKEKVILNKFSKEIPLIVHELEYYDEIAEQNLRVNPNDAIRDFVNWIINM
ncbi:hypothetical protein [Vallitalea okinawensis]|uniref:hypothetical protein n=1 Tax=Vallitalea okinawensis TaxID=2078660 RepID=UPI000CFAE774|nr:hypothetical protein [Vallitalea okinawensis]